MNRSANHLLLTLAALCCLGSNAAADEEDCRLKRAAALDMQIDEAGGATIPVTIGGQDMRMLIDTAGAFSLMKPSVVEKLKLEQKALPADQRYALMLYGHEFLNHYVNAEQIVIGHMPVIPHRQFVLLPENRLPVETSGTIAPDLLQYFDIDFDFANEKFNIFLQKHCPGQVVYWADEGTYAVVPVTLDATAHIDVPVELDGHRIKATLDTGASRSLFSWDVARRIFDIDEKSPGVTAVGEHGRYHYTFKTLTMKGDGEGVTITVQNPDIELVPDKTSGMSYNDPIIILGMGILRQLHLYVAYKEKKLYVTPASAHR